MQSRKTSRKNYSRPIKKRKHYDLGPEEESNEGDSYVTEIRRRPRKQKKEYFMKTR